MNVRTNSGRSQGEWWLRCRRVIGFVLMFAGVAACFLVLVKSADSENMRLVLAPGSVVAIVLANALAVLLVFVAWRRLVYSATGVRISASSGLFGQAALMVGKYVPGKIVGIAGRTMSLGDSVPVRSAVALVLAEQCYLLLGLAVVGLALGIGTQNAWAVLLSIALLGGVGGYLPRILSAGAALMPRRIVALMPDAGVLMGVSPATSIGILALLVFASLAVSMSAWWAPDLVGLSFPAGERLRLVGAYALAVVVGMLAVVVPGGIGVREGVFYALVGPIFGGDAALAIGAMLRLVAVGVDLLMGMAGLVLRGLMEGRRHD